MQPEVLNLKRKIWNTRERNVLIYYQGFYSRHTRTIADDEYDWSTCNIMACTLFSKKINNLIRTILVAGSKGWQIRMTEISKETRAFGDILKRE